MLTKVKKMSAIIETHVLAPRIDKTLSLKIAGLAAVLVALLLAPHLVTDRSMLDWFILILMAAQIGVAWNIIGGYAGQVSLGHVVPYGIGAYSSTLLFLHFNLSPWLGGIVGGIIAMLVAMPIGWSCFRLKGHYFAMATIAVAEVFQVLFTNWEFAGGAVGLSMPPKDHEWWMMNFSSKEPYYFIALGLLVCSLLVNLLIEKSFVGYYLRSIKDEPDAARSLGVGLARYKQVALLISSFLAALGGSLFAQYHLVIEPDSVMVIRISIDMALVAILGGVGTLWGPVFGAVVLVSIREYTRITFGGSGQGIDQIIYGLLILGIAVFYPTGIVGFFRSFCATRKIRKQAREGEA